MPAPDLVLLAVPASAHPGLSGLLGYGGAPGVDLIPYFLALLAWVGMAVTAVVVSPITALVRRIRRGRGAAPEPEPPSEPTPAPAPEPPAEARTDPP